MRNIFVALFAFLLLGATTAQAQNVAAGSTTTLRAGMTLKAPQRCADKSGATLNIVSMSSDGSTGTAILQIDCWGNTAIRNAHVARYSASVSLNGSQITISWLSNAKVGNTITGTLSSGPTLTFGNSRITLVTGWLQSGSLVFQ